MKYIFLGLFSREEEKREKQRGHCKVGENIYNPFLFTHGITLKT